MAHFDSRGRRVAGASWDGTAHIWSASPPYRRCSSPAISDDCGVVTTPVPDGRYVAVGCRERTTRIWDTARDQLLAEIETPAAVTADAFSLDGHDVAIVHRDLAWPPTKRRCQVLGRRNDSEACTARIGDDGKIAQTWMSTEREGSAARADSCSETNLAVSIRFRRGRRSAPKPDSTEQANLSGICPAGGQMSEARTEPDAHVAPRVLPLEGHRGDLGPRHSGPRIACCGLNADSIRPRHDPHRPSSEQRRAR